MYWRRGKGRQRYKFKCRSPHQIQGIRKNGNELATLVTEDLIFLIKKCNSHLLLKYTNKK
jgi:hypothetical protein